MIYQTRNVISYLKINKWSFRSEEKYCLKPHVEIDINHVDVKFISYSNENNEIYKVLLPQLSS